MQVCLSKSKWCEQFDVPNKEIFYECQNKYTSYPLEAWVLWMLDLQALATLNF